MTNPIAKFFSSYENHHFPEGGDAVVTRKPSPFKQHFVIPLKNAASRARNSGIGQKIAHFFTTSKKTGDATSWSTDSTAKADAVLDRLSDAGLNI